MAQPTSIMAWFHKRASHWETHRRTSNHRIRVQTLPRGRGRPNTLPCSLAGNHAVSIQSSAELPQYVRPEECILVRRPDEVPHQFARHVLVGQRPAAHFPAVDAVHRPERDVELIAHEINR